MIAPTRIYANSVDYHCSILMASIGNYPVLQFHTFLDKTLLAFHDIINVPLVYLFFKHTHNLLADEIEVWRVWQPKREH